jgi:hypothetical protein
MANLLGYAASGAVLATFLMRTMAPLRLVAILSNLLFLSYGYVAHIYPVFFLHLVLLPINCWRLAAICDKARFNLSLPSALARIQNLDIPPYALYFALGLLIGMAAQLTVIDATAHGL